MRKLFMLLSLLLCLSLCPYACAESQDDGLLIDLDLSQMSGTFVYAEVFQMMMDPDAYVGKTIRLSGWYDVYEDSLTGMVYTACIIPDATACCAQGIEFVWAGEHIYPEDYPAYGTDMTVTGRFETYDEDGYTYIHLVDADVVWSEEAEDDL